MSKSNVNVHNPTGRHPVVLVCEHASSFIPDHLEQLGLSADEALSHVAWDPGAAAVAYRLSAKLDAILVESTVSRLVYDCNRPPESPTAMPARSEVIDIPGNKNLSLKAREARVEQYYKPFATQLEQTLANHPVEPVLITIHSFTPVYNGVKREVEIGVLHDSDPRLADAILECAEGFNIQRNAPYGPEDEVTHTLKLHGVEHGRMNLMLEIRNDIIHSAVEQESIASHLHKWITMSLKLVTHSDTSASGGSL